MSVELSKIEQALLFEVFAWLDQARKELQAIADAKLACILEAHNLVGKEVIFRRTDSGWVMIQGEEDAAQEGEV